MRSSKIPALHLLKRYNTSSPSTTSQFYKSNSCQASVLNPSRYIATDAPKKSFLKQAKFAYNLQTQSRDQSGYRLMEATKVQRSCMETSDQHAYLSEFGKTGKVSDSDSGIASPLSPSSLYGFLGYADKERNGIGGKEERTRMMCLRETVQVSNNATLFNDDSGIQSVLTKLYRCSTINEKA